MPLQSENLVAIGLGVLADSPVNPAQPQLAPGNHLRYGFSSERGFPWYGYYIFRRLHRDSKPICVHPPEKLPAGIADAKRVETPQGSFLSDVPLKLGDAFPPTGQLEFDLRDSKRFQFVLPPGQMAREVRITLGLYGRSVPVNLADTDDLPATTKADSVAASTVSAAASTKASIAAAPPRPVLDTSPPSRLATIGSGLLNFIATVTGFLPWSRTIGPVSINAYQGQARVAHAQVSGRPQQVLTVTLTADVMDRIEIIPNSCALIEICFVPTLSDIKQGWQELRGFHYPLCLPSARADYPCAGKPSNAAQALLMAKSRVRYGAPAVWDDGRFDELTSLLDVMLANGPAGGAMADRVTSDTPIPPDDNDLQIPNLRPLDMLLFSALHPAAAQVLGLYWIDESAAPGTAYDYIVLADHDHSLTSAANALALLTAGTLPNAVDGWIVFNLKRGAVPPLAPPASPVCYGLPGGTVASTEPGAAAPAGNNTVGLNWPLPALADDGLQPGSPIFYHLWRTDVQAAPPSAAPAATQPPYILKTLDAPILVPDATAGTASTLPFASDWPPFALQAFDRHLPNGWYSYRLAGVNIFGQYSALSDPGRWHQWAPVPVPRPWYYVGASAEAELNPFAIHVRDTTPPPSPPRIQAVALDPLDPALIADVALGNWIDEHWWRDLPAATKAGHIGVRVSWCWNAVQQLQAPDVAEFRIYFHPGGNPPADARDAGNWSERIFTVAYADHVQIASNGDRTYDILLPLLNDTRFGGVALAPSNANPVAYGHIGVTAADADGETADNAKWNGTPFAGHAGNEGAIGVPAKIYRVLRDPPAPPASADTSVRVWATPADYHSLSYYTFRWPKPLTDAGLIDAHIFRAMDETLFEFDFRQRPRLLTGNAELDGLNAQTPIGSGDSEAAIKLKIRAALPLYRTLTDNALRLLASLPENADAFAQLTIEALKHAEPANADRIGPDGDGSHVPSAALCAWRAELDGKARNRYFFRAAFVNRAHDMGELGPSSPPVYLPKVAPARTPVITKILGGDRKITLTFASNREDDVAEYRIYRADDARSARDIRVMTLVGTVAESAIDLTAPGTEWIDNTGLIGGRQYHYRMAVADIAGNLSQPTPIKIGVPVDLRVPEPPYWTGANWLVRDQTSEAESTWPATGIVPTGSVPGLRIHWQSDTPTPDFSISRRLRGAQIWSGMSAGPSSGYATNDPGYYSWRDDNADPDELYEYRILVRSAAGVWSTDYRVLATSWPQD